MHLMALLIPYQSPTPLGPLSLWTSSLDSQPHTCLTPSLSLSTGLLSKPTSHQQQLTSMHHNWHPSTSHLSSVSMEFQSPSSPIEGPYLSPHFGENFSPASAPRTTIRQPTIHAPMVRLSESTPFLNPTFDIFAVTNRTTGSTIWDLRNLHTTMRHQTRQNFPPSLPTKAITHASSSPLPTQSRSWLPITWLTACASSGRNLLPNFTIHRSAPNDAMTHTAPLHQPLESAI